MRDAERLRVIVRELLHARAVGVDMDEVAAKLEREGVASFQASFDELLAALAAKADELRG